MSKSRASQTASIPPEHDEIWRSAAWRRKIRQRLLSWFDKNARDLPWRKEATEYQVWISEIMLQQTQVATVVPYYQRFLKSFPSVEALAAADEQSVLSHWEGLGYYRRARSMHAAARRIVEQHDGRFPTSFDDVIALPGIGRYTAGAILSIARNVPLPILEGNTQRVFSRWIAMRGTATDSAATKLLWEIAETMLPRKAPGTFNQAAMELGALVCSPKEPDCDRCPIHSLCQARSLGLQEQIPGKVSRLVYENRIEFAMVISDQNRTRNGRKKTPRYLLRPLPEGRRWAGLWDFPRTTEGSVATTAAAARRLSDEIGVKISPGMRLTTIKHAVTKYRIALHVHVAILDDVSVRPVHPWRYVSLTQMASLPMSVSARRIAHILADQRQTQLPL